MSDLQNFSTELSFHRAALEREEHLHFTNVCLFALFYFNLWVIQNKKAPSTYSFKVLKESEVGIFDREIKGFFFQ